MKEFLTITELKEELRKIWQAYENEDITILEFGAAAADLCQRIKDRELVLAKHDKRRELDELKRTRKISGLSYASAINSISLAKTKADLNKINPFIKPI